MEILSIDLDRCLGHQQEVTAAIASGDASHALDLYLEHYDDLHARASLEWRLLARVVRASDLSPLGMPWHEGLLRRGSGASLAFAVAQANGGASELSSGLLTPRVVPRRYRSDLIAAWHRRPDCKALAAPQQRRRFVAVLAEDRALLGLWVSATSLAGDPTLAAELADRRLEHGLCNPTAPERIADVGGIPSLAEFAFAAFELAVGLFYNDAEALPKLDENALELGRYSVLLDLTTALLERPLKPDQTRRVLELRLASLADEPGSYAGAAAEYRELWQPLAQPYPQPERLLYAFQQLGEGGLERHRLESTKLDETTPRWVSLSRECLRGVSQRRMLEKWVALYAEESSDERVLVGATSAVLRCPRPLRQAWAERLELPERWRQLAGYEPYRHLAGAFLIRIQEFDEERITVFETFFADASFSSVPRGACLRRRRKAERAAAQYRSNLELTRRAEHQGRAALDGPGAGSADLVREAELLSERSLAAAVQLASLESRLAKSQVELAQARSELHAEVSRIDELEERAEFQVAELTNDLARARDGSRWRR